MNKWINEEYRDIKKEEEEFREQKGMKELLRMEKGDNKITLDLKNRPKRVETKYGQRDVWDLVSPEGKTLMLHPLTSRALIKFIVENENNPNVVVIKSGELKETRYEFKEWSGNEVSGASAPVSSVFDWRKREGGVE